MNNKIAGLPALALAAALLVSATGAMAQMDAKPSEAEAKPAAVSAPAEAQADEEEFELVPLQIGDATQSLLAWQRSGEIASPTPRNIAGNVAGRSYDRYIKSFEFPIPERLGSTVSKSSSGASGASSGAR